MTLTQADIAQLKAVLGEMPHKHAITVLAVFAAAEARDRNAAPKKSSPSSPAGVGKPIIDAIAVMPAGGGC